MHSRTFEKEVPTHLQAKIGAHRIDVTFHGDSEAFDGSNPNAFVEMHIDYHPLATSKGAAVASPGKPVRGVAHFVPAAVMFEFVGEAVVRKRISELEDADPIEVLLGKVST